MAGIATGSNALADEHSDGADGNSTDGNTGSGDAGIDLPREYHVHLQDEAES